MSSPFNMFLALICCICFSVSCTESGAENLTVDITDLSSRKIIDLTHVFSEKTIYWVTAKEFELDTVFKGHTDKGYYYSANNICAAEHGGTHVDAPIHFAEGKQSVEEIPIQNLVGPAIKVDVSSRALEDRDYQISIDDFKEWEANQGKTLPDGSIVLVQTGYGQYYPDKIKYLGTDERGEEAVAKLHFPGLSPEAAQWLVDERNIKAFGLDTPSLDYGQSTDFKTHVILLSENIPGFENLANLDQLPAEGFEIIALPMKIKGGSGAPLRVIALM